MGNFPKSIFKIILVITLLNIGVHSESLKYPEVRRDESIVDDYHGTKVKDPYRWLEERDAGTVSEFVGAQNELTSTYLGDCKQRRQFKEGLQELWAYPKYGLPERRGSRYFYFAQQRGGEVLYVQENKTSTPRALIDPQLNGIITFPSFGVSSTGELVVYKEVVRIEGVPRITGNLRILNISSGDVFPEILDNIQAPAVAWDGDGRGFFYSSHTNTGESSEEEDETPKFYVYYHKVGTSQDKDVLAVDYADFGDEPYFVDMEMSVDEKFLLFRTRAYDGPPPKPKTNSTFYIADITKFQEIGGSGSAQRQHLVPVVTRRTAGFFVEYVANIGNNFYFRSRLQSKNYDLIEINPYESTLRVVIDENKNYILQGATIVDKSKVLLSYTSEKLNSYAELRDLQNGSLIRIFPLEFGELLSFSGNIGDSEVLFRGVQLEGLPELFYFDVRDPRGPMKRLVQNPTLSRYDPSEFVTEVVTYPSVDGDNVEMILLHRKDLKRDGTSYAIIAEREFDLDFYFRIYFSYMKDFNLVVAFPHLEEGKTGRSGFRDSSLDDFIAATEYLIQHGYSSGSRIIARGQNTFGLFLASAVNKRPELFGAAITSLVAFDMLRFDVVANSSQDFALVQDVEEFNRTFAISPLHNIHLPVNGSVQYPGIFIPTPNEYPVPLAYKYLAELQHSLGQGKRQTKPFLMRVVPEVGMDAIDIGLFSKYHIERETDIRCFLEKTIGISYT